MCRWLAIAKESRDLSYKNLKKYNLDKYLDDDYDINASKVMRDELEAEDIYMVSVVSAFHGIYSVLKDEHEGKEPTALALTHPSDSEPVHKSSKSESDIMDALKKELGAKELGSRGVVKSIDMSNPTQEDLDNIKKLASLLQHMINDKEDK